MNDLDTAYWAGVFDAKAHINMRTLSGRNHKTPYFVIKSTSEEFLKPLQLAFGGTIRQQKTYNTNHALVYVWERTACSAREVISALNPFMREHREITREVLQWRPKRKRHTPVVFPPTPRAVNGASMSGSK